MSTTTYTKDEELERIAQDEAAHAARRDGKRDRKHKRKIMRGAR